MTTLKIRALRFIAKLADVIMTWADNKLDSIG